NNNNNNNNDKNNEKNNCNNNNNNNNNNDKLELFLKKTGIEKITPKDKSSSVPMTMYSTVRNRKSNEGQPSNDDDNDDNKEDTNNITMDITANADKPELLMKNNDEDDGFVYADYDPRINGVDESPKVLGEERHLHTIHDLDNDDYKCQNLESIEPFDMDVGRYAVPKTMPGGNYLVVNQDRWASSTDHNNPNAMDEMEDDWLWDQYPNRKPKTALPMRNHYSENDVARKHSKSQYIDRSAIKLRAVKEVNDFQAPNNTNDFEHTEDTITTSSVTDHHYVNDFHLQKTHFLPQKRPSVHEKQWEVSRNNLPLYDAISAPEHNQRHSSHSVHPKQMLQPHFGNCFFFFFFFKNCMIFLKNE
ncbi:hypothetical protein RFI_12852, partial [Reticulomyxa filosa]